MEGNGSPGPPPRGRILEDKVLPLGADWARILEPGQVLRMVDLEGKQAVDFLCYDADDLTDRYHAGDTIKYAGTIYLTTGHGLFTTKATRLFTIIADTCGRHDTLGACCSPGNNGYRYGAADAPSCYTNFLRALARFGMDARDIVPNINFFMNIPVGADGSYTISDSWSKPGDYVDLRADHRALAVISNCPQTRNAANGFNPTPVRVLVYESTA